VTSLRDCAALCVDGPGLSTCVGYSYAASPAANDDGCVDLGVGRCEIYRGDAIQVEGTDALGHDEYECYVPFTRSELAFKWVENGCWSNSGGGDGHWESPLGAVAHVHCCTEAGECERHVSGATNNAGCFSGGNSGVPMQTYDGAVAICAADGMRLCTKDELLSEGAAGCCSTGCSHDSAMVWTNTSLSLHSDTHKSMQADLQKKALQEAQKLFAVAAEFHATNMHVTRNMPRTPAPDTPSMQRPYKAIVVLFLNGGVDSFNLLMPHSNCTGYAGPRVDRDFYEEYKAIRGEVAMTKEDMAASLIDASGSSQPCDTFGIHPQLTLVKELYDGGNATFLANVGTLVEPLTKDEYLSRSKSIPNSLFAHNTQVSTTQSVHAGATTSRKGVLGRIVESLSGMYKTRGYSINGQVPIMDGEVPADVLSSNGVPQFAQDTMKENVHDFTRLQSSSIFAETFNSLLQRSLHETEAIGGLLDATTTTATFEDDGLSQQFMQVAKLMRGRDMMGENATEREVFFVSLGGFDTHSDLRVTMDEKLLQVNTALTSFVEELKVLGLWDNVAVMMESEFGRTMSSNGVGTDHGWGGNYFMLGGSLKGGRVLGDFPSRLDHESDLNIGKERGRLIPTTSWESVWNGVAQWFGVDEDMMEGVLPNLGNFPGQLFTRDDMFH